jgi:superfamily II DNA or RNA helicase
MIVSFIKSSGIELLRSDLEYIRTKKIPFRLITGTYMGITEPAALYKLKSILKDHGELYFFDDLTVSFHPKAYFFETDLERSVFVGSSNLSRSALKEGVEWNYHIEESVDPVGYRHFQSQFETILNKRTIPLTDEVLRNYSANWIKPKDNFDNSPIIQAEVPLQAADQGFKYAVSPIFKPNDAQVEALYELNRIREMGASKGLVVAATGIGKTYLAAFDSLGAGRVLFVAHREEILKQAARTFKSIRPEASICFIGTGQKAYHQDLVFASVQTLTKKFHLNQIEKDAFEYLIIDEFHHASADSYQRILDHFEPRFLLGLTATPHRLDNQDIFALCDYNVAYEVDLFSAIEKGWLVPFKYYGIYDDTVDYDQIPLIGGNYNEQALEAALSIHKRANLILKHFDKHQGKHVIAFCATIVHADAMAKVFNANGIPSAAVHSKSENRVEAIEQLKTGKLQVIFTVDLFNEGVDIKEIDLVLFLRPTESPIVFLQQLGRGLRKCPSKKSLIVLDFIGNHKKIHLLPQLFLSRRLGHPVTNLRDLRPGVGIPEGCMIDFDFQIIDLYEKQAAQKRTLEDTLKKEFIRIRDNLGRIPMRVDMIRMMRDDLYDWMRKNGRLNCFKNYIDFLESMDIVTGLKTEHYSLALEFVKTLENTSMSKMYKIPVVMAFFYNDTNETMKPIELFTLVATEEALYQSFKSFYESSGQNALDMYQHAGTRDFKTWRRDQYLKTIYDNPVKFLCRTHPDFFEPEGRNLKLNDGLSTLLKDEIFVRHVKDTLEFRRLEFLRNRLLKQEHELYEKMGVHKESEYEE